MSIVDISLDLENLPDAALAQLGQGGDPRYPQYLVAAEVQRRKDMRDRYRAQQAKHEQAQTKPVLEARIDEMMGGEGGIPSADPSAGQPDPSLQTGIAGPPPGGPPPMAVASGGLIPGYHKGGEYDLPHKHEGASEHNPTGRIRWDVPGIIEMEEARLGPQERPWGTSTFEGSPME